MCLSWLVAQHCTSRMMSAFVFVFVWGLLSLDKDMIRFKALWELTLTITSSFYNLSIGGGIVCRFGATFSYFVFITVRSFSFFFFIFFFFHS